MVLHYGLMAALNCLLGTLLGSASGMWLGQVLAGAIIMPARFQGQTLPT